MRIGGPTRFDSYESKSLVPGSSETLISKSFGRGFPNLVNFHCDNLYDPGKMTSFAIKYFRAGR